MTQPLRSSASGIVAIREHCIGDGSKVCLAEPDEIGVRALFSMGWTDWTGVLRGLGVGIDCFVVPVPRGALQKVPDESGTRTDLHAAIAGDARKPFVLQRSLDSAGGSVMVWVPPSLACFRGHFPAHPVVPGVVLMGWAVDEIRRLRPDGPRIREFRQVKFQRVVMPCDTLKISWTLTDASHATYVVESCSGVNAKGQCVFEEAR
jgi:3-hydroxymyristoyl/3-hydroxydecanoyl-(acyl carrier protein) dehydratase